MSPIGVKRADSNFVSSDYGRPQLQKATLGTGATFHSDIDMQPELYEGREPVL